MSMPADYHMHTPLCRHATGEPVDYARRAVELGLTEIGFSDHSPMPRDDFDNWRMFDRQLDEYVGKVRLAQKEFPQLTIRLALAAESKLFDVIGHADLPKKFGIRPAQDCTPLYENFLDAAARGGCAIELNTAGLRKDCREIYPCPALLRLAFQKKVPITFGSDAHAPAEVGMNFAEAVALARSVGYRETVRFNRRQRETVPF